jgi:hypothetical protein
VEAESLPATTDFRNSVDKDEDMRLLYLTIAGEADFGGGRGWMVIKTSILN